MKTLIEKLVPLADKLRGLHETFGTRGHKVDLVAVRRRSREDETSPGTAEEISRKAIRPAPRLRDASQVWSPEEIGRINKGTLVADQITFSLSYEDLVGKAWETDEEVDFFWEVSLTVPKQATAQILRFRPAEQPWPKQTALGWSVVLDAILSDNAADGGFLPPYGS